MLYAAIKDCPVFGGKLVSFDDAKIEGSPACAGAVRVNESAVAVVADTWWRAKNALDALPIVWDEGPNANGIQRPIAAHLKSGLTASDAFADTNYGDALKAIAGAAKKIEAVYSLPFVSHATMEPMNCTARLSADKAEIWLPTQNAEASLAALSTASGLPLDKCEVYKHRPRRRLRPARRQPGLRAPGGGDRQTAAAGHSGEVDLEPRGRPGPRLLPADRAVQTAAGLDQNGNLAGLHIRVSGQSINAYAQPGGDQGRQGCASVAGLWKAPGDAQFGYTVPNLQIEYAMRNTHVPVGPWRGVNTNQNGIFLECFMDEVAQAAGKDPLEFRRALMQNHPKHLGVLNAAAEKADWGKPLPAGVYRGIAQFMGYAQLLGGSCRSLGQRKGEVKVHRMVLATNFGHAVNPDQIAAQVEGGVVYGLSTLLSECSVDKGRIVELNFDNYR